MSLPPSDRNVRVLVIDDNRAIHDDFRKILDGRSQTQDKLEAAVADLFGEEAPVSVAPVFDIDSAFQGQEGLERVVCALAEARPYALAFVDVRMPPGWDGIETIEQIWKVDPDVQIVLCTAYSDYSWDDMIRRLGHSDRLLILKKPFDNIEALQLATALSTKWTLQQQEHRHVEQLEEIVRGRTEELRTSEQRYRLITQNAGDLIGIVDFSGQATYRSPSFGPLLGFSPEELAALPTYELVHEEDRAGLIAVTHECMEQGVQRVCDVRVRRKDGAWLTLEAHCGPFRTDGGAVEGALLVARDVTERRQLEVQLRQAQKLESIGQLATGIAHEINTPTQFINDNTHFLRDAFNDLQTLLTRYHELFTAAEAGGVTPALLESIGALRKSVDPDYLAVEIPRAIDQTLDGVSRTSRIVKAMRNFAHPGTAEKTTVNLRNVVEDTLTITRNEWRYVADTAVEFDPQLPPVPVFPGEFSQVLLNLVINATHTIEEKVGDGDKGKGLITISARRDGDAVELRLSDSGMGIPEHVRNRIFDPFFTTKPVGKGTGQGLTLARSIIVEKHGGSLEFESTIGEGTVFIIRLPLAISADEAKPCAAAPRPAAA
jgi:two-component system, NtrC family, sensor kinase